MTVEELVKKDSSFNSSIFISKVNSMIKRLYNATTLDKIDTVDHFASDKVFKIFKDELESAKSRNERVVYEQVSVNSEIRDIYEFNNIYQIRCLVYIQYYKYYLDMNGNISSGDPNSKIKELRNIIVQKLVNNNSQNNTRCLGCGAIININSSGKCPNCGRIFDLEKFDYYIEEFMSEV